MSDERGFTGREVGAFAAFAVVGILLGVGAYRVGNTALSGANSGASVAVAPDNALPNGKDLYVTNCAGCHGANAQGGVGVALKTAAGYSDAEFKAAVLEGKSPTKELTPVMPRFGTTGLGGAPATDEQVKAIHEYVKSLVQ